MLRACPYAAVVLAACGRIHFDVGSDGSSDAFDAPPGSGGTPRVISYEGMHMDGAVAMSLPVSVPSATRFALGVVHVAQDCGMDTAAPMVTVRLGGSAFTAVDGIVGTPCGAAVTKSEVFALATPPVRSSTLAVDFSPIGRSAHVYVVYFAGGNPGAPIRSIAKTSGRNIAGSVSVASDPTDLVISFAGHGDMVVGPEGALQQLYLNNVSFGLTLDNTAAATQPGMSPAITTSWQFNSTDEFQVISLSLAGS